MNSTELFINNQVSLLRENYDLKKKTFDHLAKSLAVRIGNYAPYGEAMLVKYIEKQQYILSELATEMTNIQSTLFQYSLILKCVEEDINNHEITQTG